MSWNVIYKELKLAIIVIFLIIMFIVANNVSAANVTSNASNTSGNIPINDKSLNLGKPIIPWAIKASMPTSRTDLFRGRLAIGNKIYVAGGWNGSVLDIVEVYDVSMDNWTKAAPLPSPGLNGAIQSINGKLYVINGDNFDGVGNIWEYDPVTDNYTEKTSFGGGDSITSAVINDKIYVISKVTEMYDPIEDKWTPKAPHPLPRQYLTAQAANGKIFTFGGNRNPDLLHEYDPETDNWTQKSSMPVMIDTPNSEVVNGKIFVVGGDNSKEVWMYDPLEDVWTGPLDYEIPTARALAATAHVNGSIYVIGGCCPAAKSDANEKGTILFPSVNAERKINVESLRLGRSTNITILINSNENQSFVLQEFIPLGWNLTRISDDADGFKNSSNEWAWLNVSSGTTKTLTYMLASPDDADIGTYYINGTIATQNGEIEVIEGNNTITLDIFSYYRRLGSDPEKLETTDLLKAMDDWRSGTMPPGFARQIMTWELTDLVNEWAMS